MTLKMTEGKESQPFEFDSAKPNELDEQKFKSEIATLSGSQRLHGDQGYGSSRSLYLMDSDIFRAKTDCGCASLCHDYRGRRAPHDCARAIAGAVSN